MPPGSRCACRCHCHLAQSVRSFSHASKCSKSHRRLTLPPDCRLQRDERRIRVTELAQASTAGPAGMTADCSCRQKPHSKRQHSSVAAATGFTHMRAGCKTRVPHRAGGMPCRRSCRPSIVMALQAEASKTSNAAYCAASMVRQADAARLHGSNAVIDDTTLALIVIRRRLRAPAAIVSCAIVCACWISRLDVTACIAGVGRRVARWHSQLSVSCLRHARVRCQIESLQACYEQSFECKPVTVLQCCSNIVP